MGILKKQTKQCKSIILVILTLLSLTAVACKKEEAPENTANIPVTLSIRCEDMTNSETTAENTNGTIEIITKRSCYITDGETVYDLLVRTLQQDNIAIGSQSSAYGRYVTTIAGYAAGDNGANSGWSFYVNGSIPELGCDAYKLQKDDEVEWVYRPDQSKAFE